jgi:hypothetical protein
MAKKKRTASTGMPKAGPVKVTKIDGSVTIVPPYKGGTTKNIGIYKK